jgi:hypothetical protein
MGIDFTLQRAALPYLPSRAAVPPAKPQAGWR